MAYVIVDTKIGHLANKNFVKLLYSFFAQKTNKIWYLVLFLGTKFSLLSVQKGFTSI